MECFVIDDLELLWLSVIGSSQELCQASDTEEDEVVNGHFVTLALDRLGGQFRIEEEVCCVDAIGDLGLRAHRGRGTLPNYCTKLLRQWMLSVVAPRLLQMKTWIPRPESVQSG